MRAALLPRIAHLSVDLRLAEHHRVETARDAKEMRRRVAIASHVAVSGRIASPSRAESVAHTAGAASVSASTRYISVRLHVESSDRLARTGASRKRVERRRDLGGPIREALANVERRAAMVDADDDQRHSAILDAKRPDSTRRRSRRRRASPSRSPIGRARRARAASRAASPARRTASA